MIKSSRSERKIEKHNAKLQKLLEKGHILTPLTEFLMVKALLENNAHCPQVIYRFADKILKSRSKMVIVEKEVE